MRYAWALIVLLVGCRSTAPVDATRNKVAGAAVAAGFGVAAAGVYRATTHGCWADCRPGLRCDHASGTCVPIEPSSARAARRAANAPDGGTLDAESIDTSADPCRGLCFSGERCVVR